MNNLTKALSGMLLAVVVTTPYSCVIANADIVANICPIRDTLVTALEDSLNNEGEWGYYTIISESHSSMEHHYYIRVALENELYFENHTVVEPNNALYACVNASDGVLLSRRGEV